MASINGGFKKAGLGARRVGTRPCPPMVHIIELCIMVVRTIVPEESSGCGGLKVRLKSLGERAGSPVFVNCSFLQLVVSWQVIIGHLCPQLIIGWLKGQCFVVQGSGVSGSIHRVKRLEEVVPIQDIWVVEPLVRYVANVEEHLAGGKPVDNFTLSSQTVGRLPLPGWWRIIVMDIVAHLLLPETAECC